MERKYVWLAGFLVVLGLVFAAQVGAEEYTDIAVIDEQYLGNGVFVRKTFDAKTNIVCYATTGRDFRTGGGISCLKNI